MINKNFYRKTNDKKILHKVGKQWKVISVALLMAIGGAAVATHVNANADANDGVDTTPYAANQAQFAQKPASAKPQQQSSSAGVSYYPANSGSAAMYFDRVASDEGVAAKNYNTVNSYVQSLNNEYNPQVHSYSVSSASARSAASKDTNLASSFSATVQKPGTTNTINSLAAKNRMVPSVYEATIEDNEQAFSSAVGSASADVKAASDVNSLVNRLQGTNLSDAYTSASQSSVTAESNYYAARDNLQSVDARYGVGDTTAASYVNIANKLRADIQGLLANGNPVGQGAEYGLLTQAGVGDPHVGNFTTATEQASLTSAISQVASYATDEYKTAYSNALTHGVTSLGNFADNMANSSFVGEYGNSYAALGINTNNDVKSEYNGAISEAANERFAGILESAANSLDASFHGQYANSLATSAERSSAEASASAAFRSAGFAYDFASDNADFVDNVSDEVDYYRGLPGVNTEAEAKADAAWDYLINPNGDGKKGADRLADDFYIKADTHNYTINSNIHAIRNYNRTVAANLPSNEKNVFNNIIGTQALNYNNTSDIENQIEGIYNDVNTVAGDLNSLINNDNGQANANANSNLSSTIDSGAANLSAFSEAHNSSASAAKSVMASAAGTNYSSNGASLGTLSSAITPLVNELSDIANVAGNVTANNLTDANSRGLAHTTSEEFVPNNYNNDYFEGRAALLSDGIDMDQLEAESGAIENVASAVYSAAANSQNNSDANVNFNDELSIAASSANSALTSTTNVSNSDSSANDENVTLASYFASSYTSDASVESASASAVSVATNNFFKYMANDDAFNTADDAYAGAEAAAANDKKIGEDYSANVFNNSPHFLDVLKNAKLHANPNFGSKADKIIGTAHKGDRLTVLGVNFNRNGHIHGATRYLVYDNMTKQKGFVTGQYQGDKAYTKAAYLSSRLDYNNVNVSVKILKPVAVKDNINGGKTVKTLKPGTVVDNVTIVNDNPTNDAMGFTKVETSDYNFFTANTDYVELNSVVPKNNNNNQPNNFEFGLGNVGLGIAYNNNGQINK